MFSLPKYITLTDKYGESFNSRIDTVRYEPFDNHILNFLTIGDFRAYPSENKKTLICIKGSKVEIEVCIDGQQSKEEMNKRFFMKKKDLKNILHIPETDNYYDYWVDKTRIF